MALFGSFAMLFYYILRIFLKPHETDRRFLTHDPTDSAASKTRNLAGTSRFRSTLILTSLVTFRPGSDSPFLPELFP